MALLAAWLGIAIYFSAVVAPSAFGVLRSFSLANASEIAGTIVSRALSAVNKSGLVLSLFLLVSAPVVKKYYGRWSFILQNVLISVVAILTAGGEWVIAARMRGLRTAMNGQIDQVPLTDPNRIAFSVLHTYSVAALSVALLAALVVILLMVVSRERVVTDPTE
ncbi:MAG: DUF4149 domain-containing protein [Pyrinomonadaceae bacterium]